MNELLITGNSLDAFFSKIGKEFAERTTLTELSSLIVAYTKEVFKVETCSLMLVNDRQNELYIVCASGLPRHIIEETRIKIGSKSISGYVAREKKPLLISDIKKDLPVSAEPRAKYKTPSFISLPLLVGNQIIGVLNLTDREDKGSFESPDLEKALFYINQTAMAFVIERTRLLDKQAEETKEKEVLLQDIITLNSLSCKLSASLSIDEIINTLNEGLFSLFSLHLCCILFVVEHENRLSISTSFSPTSNCLEKIKRHIKKKANLFMPDIDIERFTLNLQERSNCKRIPAQFFTSSLNLPLVSQHETFGLIIIGREKERLFTRHNLKLFSTITNQSSSCLMTAKLFKDVKELADRDGLTKLFNHRAFYERLQQEIERAKRFNEKLSLLFFDLDNFKGINDKYGHLIGDEFLLKFALLLKENLRRMDIPARYGGEEFCVILPETPEKKAKQIAERVRKAVAKEEFLAKEMTVHITVSCGVASFSDEVNDAVALLKIADQKMYTAKKGGKNRVI